MHEDQTHVVYHRGPSIFEYHAAEGTDRLLIYRVEVRPAWAAPGQFAWGVRNAQNEVVWRGDSPLAAVSDCIEAAEEALLEMAANAQQTAEISGTAESAHYAISPP